MSERTQNEAAVIDDPQVGEWLHRLDDLFAAVRPWCEAAGWSTRIISVPVRNDAAGPYQAPALLMQQETLKAIFEPAFRFEAEGGGAVHLYVMPEFDDVASLAWERGRWTLRYPRDAFLRDETPGAPGELTRESLTQVLEALKSNAS